MIIQIREPRISCLNEETGKISCKVKKNSSYDFEGGKNE